MSNKTSRPKSRGNRLRVVSFTLPTAWQPSLARAMADEDLDFSKITRRALRAYLEERGLPVGPWSPR